MTWSWCEMLSAIRRTTISSRSKSNEIDPFSTVGMERKNGSSSEKFWRVYEDRETSKCTRSTVALPIQLNPFYTTTVITELYLLNTIKGRGRHFGVFTDAIRINTIEPFVKSLLMIRVRNLGLKNIRGTWSWRANRCAGSVCLFETRIFGDKTRSRYSKTCAGPGWSTSKLPFACRC